MVWQLWLDLAAPPAQIPSSSSQPTHVCVLCPRWGRFLRTARVMRSQTALNGPRQAAWINNLLRLKSSHREQHSVKCQQEKNSNWSYVRHRCRGRSVSITFPPSVILQPPRRNTHHTSVSCLVEHSQLSTPLSAEGAVSVPAVQPHCQDWLHPWGGHTGGPVRVLEALRGAVIGH